MEDLSYLFEDIHWDTLITHPVKYLKNEKIKLYHYTDKKLDKIIPLGMNVGNKIARKPRKSSWWTEHEDEWALPVQIFLKCKYRESFGKDIYWDSKALHAHKNADGTLSVGMLITKEFYNEHRSEIDKIVVYRYDKTFNIRDVGRGTEPTVPEWTTEIDVIPDNVEKLDIKGLFKHKAINFATKEEIKEASDYREALSKKYNTPFVFPYLSNYDVEWWKYDGNTYKEKRKEAEKKYGVNSYMDIHKKALTESENNLLPLFEDVLTLKKEYLSEDTFVESEETKIADVIDGIKDITYGFISKKDGSRIADRDWIHGCKNLHDYYETNWDPTVTLKNKLGICVDQSLATKYLMNKYHPEIETQLYALYKGRFGHCVFTFKDEGKYYYLEHAWDKEAALHGPFDSKDDLENYLNFIYYKNHYKDNDDPVVVKEYHPDILKESREDIFYGIISID